MSEAPDKQGTSLFISNKYTKVYFSIINNAKNKHYSGYTESHHIIPKSLGGTNNIDNLVSLSGREHFVCHWLLTKMVSGLSKSKMVFALNCMLNRKNATMDRYAPTSRLYEQMRSMLSEAHKLIRRSDSHKLAISKRHTGKIVSDATKN